MQSLICGALFWATICLTPFATGSNAVFSHTKKNFKLEFVSWNIFAIDMPNSGWAKMILIGLVV